MRRCLALLAFGLAVVGAAAPAGAEEVSAFIARFEAKAVEAGISRELYRAVTADLAADPRVPNLIASQPEFTTPIWDYLDKRVSAGRIADGRRAFTANKDLIAEIGRQSGVDPYLLAAIWGIESDYGAVLSNTGLIRPVIPALVTVSAQHRGRYAEDEAELIAALRLIAEKGWTRETLVGSWAGAIGHTQVIVSALLTYGTDGDGDKRIDPHTSLADAVATSATYLRGIGYRTGQDWGYEVVVPDGFDLLLATRESMRPVKFFAERGIKRVAGRDFSDPDEEVFLYLPAGRDGPAFLMTANYLVLKGYNFSDSYALSVAHLTDRLKGGGPFITPWPRKAVLPNLEQRITIQQELKRLGLYDGVVDGRIGPVTQRAYAQFQAAHGMPADGFLTAASVALLQDAAP